MSLRCLMFEKLQIRLKLFGHNKPEQYEYWGGYVTDENETTLFILYLEKFTKPLRIYIRIAIIRVLQLFSQVIGNKITKFICPRHRDFKTVLNF